MEILAIYLGNSLTIETAYMYHKNRYSEKVPRYVPKQKRTTVYRYTGFTAHLYRLVGVTNIEALALVVSEKNFFFHVLSNIGL